jgi:hypothetical protein
MDSKTTQDFISLFPPLMLTMNDLFRREKFARLPLALDNQITQTTHV